MKVDLKIRLPLVTPGKVLDGESCGILETLLEIGSLSGHKGEMCRKWNYLKSSAVWCGVVWCSVV